MKIRGCLLGLACITLAHAGIQSSFWLSRCAWEATDVVELAVAPGEARFRVVASLKGGARPGDIKKLPELAPPEGQGHLLLKDLAFRFPDRRAYTNAPPIRDMDRLIVFLRPGDTPANWTMLTSAIWLQDGTAYAFIQTINPGPTQLAALRFASGRLENGKVVELSPKQDEAQLRAEIGRLLYWRQTFDQAVANPNAWVRAEKLARLVTSCDDVVIRGALERLNSEGTAAARALRPYLDDDRLLNEHFRILDTMALIGARDIRLDSVIRRETSYWRETCPLALDVNWLRNYTRPPSFHYLRLVSALKAIGALRINADVPSVRELAKVIRACPHLAQQEELVQATAAVLER